jgi:uroporphyrinogen-III synthase
VKNSKSILVTRKLDSNSVIRKWAVENGYQLLEKSFIQTIPVAGLSIPETDWIFFSSPQGAKLYFELYPIRASKIAALSDGTAQELVGLKQKVSFVGKSTNTTKETGIEFFNTVDSDETVLFPLSDISKRNVSTQKGAHNVIELITYKTELISQKLDEIPTLILFTSPSNVDGFLVGNSIEEDTKVLAIGETTAFHLKNAGFKNIHVSESTREEILLGKIQFLLKD